MQVFLFCLSISALHLAIKMYWETSQECDSGNWSLRPNLEIYKTLLQAVKRCLKFEAILGSVCLNSDLNVTRKSVAAELFFFIPALRA